MPIKDFTIEQVQQLCIESVSFSELARKLKYRSRGAILVTIKNFLIKNEIDFSHFTGQARDKVVRTPENTFVENSTANRTVLRRMYIKYKCSEYKCSICGQAPFWNGKELSLTLDHINGKNDDHRLENLRWICPNCDRQLDTFCQRNY